MTAPRLFSYLPRVALAGALLALTVPTTARAQADAPTSAAHPAAPSAPSVTPDEKRVFMVSDSVGLGAKSKMAGAFPSDWQVTVTGKAGLFTEQLATNYVQYQPLSAFGDHAIVATGYNYPYWDPPRFDRAIDQMVNTLKSKGVKYIHWVTMREVTPSLYSGWYSLSSAYRTLYLAYPGANDQLRAAQARHPELSIIDWALVANQTGLTYDAIHLNTTGANRYVSIASRGVRNAITRLPATTVTEVPVAGVNGVPADAVAAALNLTVFTPRRSGFLTAYPCGGDRPIVSSLNFRSDQIVASSAIVPIGVDGKICVYQSTDAHVIVDVTGSFGPDSGWISLTPARAVDTRPTGAVPANTVRTVNLSGLEGAPDGAFVAAVNLTVLGTTADAQATLFTCGTTPPPFPSRLITAKWVQSIQLLVETDAEGNVCVVVDKSAHVLVDLFGAFTETADIHPFSPVRIRDTTSGAMPGAGSILPHQISGQFGVPADPVPTATFVTLTLVSAQGIGYAVAYPCSSGVPATSTVNVVPNRTQTNGGPIPLDAAGQVCVYISVASHVRVDISGWAGTAFTPLTPARAFDSRSV